MTDCCNNRIMLREMKKEDLDDLFSLLSDDEVMRYLEPVYSREQTGAFLQEEGIRKKRVLAVEYDGSFAGYAIYHEYDEESMEIGWVLLPAFWGRGIASFVGSQLKKQAEQHGKKTVIECLPEQAVTAHLAEKLGLVYAGKRGRLDVYRSV